MNATSWIDGDTANIYCDDPGRLLGRMVRSGYYFSDVLVGERRLSIKCVSKMGARRIRDDAMRFVAGLGGQ